MNEYDPDTCFTAGELRDIGYPIPKRIPDVAWIPKWSMRPLPNTCRTFLADSCIVRFEVEFTQPFRWLECTFTLKEETNDRDSVQTEEGDS